jgi:hypothetical protein
VGEGGERTEGDKERSEARASVAHATDEATCRRIRGNVLIGRAQAPCNAEELLYNCLRLLLK